VQVARSPTSPNLRYQTKRGVSGIRDFSAKVDLHRSVESIAAHNHVKMGRRESTRLRRWVEPLVRQSRTWEAETRLCGCDEGGQQPKRWRKGLHLGQFS